MLDFLLTPLTQKILKKPENMGMLFEPIGMCATSDLSPRRRMTLLRLNYSLHAQRKPGNYCTEDKSKADAIHKLSSVEAIVPISFKAFRARQDHKGGA